MRILHIIPDLQQGGAQRLCLDICNELGKRKEHEVLLVNLYDSNEYKKLSNNINRVVCNSRVIPSLSGKTFVDLSNYTKIIEEFKPDIIHSHLFEAEMLSRFSIFKSIGYVTHCHDNMHQLVNFPLKAINKKIAFTNYYEKKILLKGYKKSNNQFIAISKDTHTYFCKVLPKSFSSKITILPNAIDYNFFYNHNTISLSNPIKLITVGSLVDKKNQLFLVDVMKILKSKGLDITLAIFGEGPNRFKIETKIKSEKLEDVIKLYGNVENIKKYFHASTIYVHAATYEPFGLVILEAMAAGLPVISLDGKGNRDVIINGQNGFLFDIVNPEIFANKIIELIGNPILFNQISQQAKEYVEKYDIKNYVDQLLGIYKKSMA